MPLSLSWDLLWCASGGRLFLCRNGRKGFATVIAIKTGHPTKMAIFVQKTE